METFERGLRLRDRASGQAAVVRPRSGVSDYGNARLHRQAGRLREFRNIRVLARRPVRRRVARRRARRRPPGRRRQVRPHRLRLDEGILRGYSEALGLYLCWEHGYLRFYDPETGHLLTYDEQRRSTSSRRKSRADAAESERRRARRTSGKSARADAAEARARQLEEEAPTPKGESRARKTPFFQNPIPCAKVDLSPLPQGEG